jgi:hypothetical protein
MRAIKELAGVLAAAILTFCGGIALAVAFTVLWACGVASGLCLMVALFAVVMFGITGKPHDGQIALTYLGYASIPFALTFVAGYYRSKFGGPVAAEPKLHFGPIVAP